LRPRRSRLPVARDKVQNKGSGVLIFDVMVAAEVKPEDLDAASEVGTAVKGAKETDAPLRDALGLVVENGGDNGVQVLAGRCEVRKVARWGQQGAAAAKVDRRLPGLLKVRVLGAVRAQRFCDARQDQER
jgi:hypothetical protein